MLLSPEKIYALRGQTILGVNPPVLDFAWFDLWAKPAGLLNVLGFLRSRGNRVHLLDLIYEGRTKPAGSGRWKVARERLEKPAALEGVPRHFHRFGLGPLEFAERLADLPKPDIILVTSIMTYWYLGVFETIDILKQRYPKVPVILGGIYALLCPDHAARSGADFILSAGGPDLPFVPTPLDLYAGPERRSTPTRPGRQGFAAASTEPAPSGAPGYAIVSTSSGCPRRCAYCASALITPRFRPKPLEDIYADLAHQMSLGSVTDLAFYDDALLWDKDSRFHPLCRHIRERYPRLRLHTPNGLSVDELDRRTCDTLRRTGFTTLRLSLEGLDQSTNSAGHGKTSRDNFCRAVDNLLAAGYNPADLETYLLAGLPGQRPEDVERSIEFVKSIGGRPKLCEFSPIPGTRLFQQAAETSPVILEEPLWHNNTVYGPYLSPDLPPDVLQRLKNSLAADNIYTGCRK